MLAHTTAFPCSSPPTGKSHKNALPISSLSHAVSVSLCLSFEVLEKKKKTTMATQCCFEITIQAYYLHYTEIIRLCYSDANIHSLQKGTK